ncbi:hypothetical protein ACQ33O_06275 [Ferruginibacter sp. SUN002]|uniref:hypothetical protein n=1 Tax=Ferruginibacter sp. SUN002 TaxID=2937789 RepID=UPI003D3630F6
MKKSFLFVGVLMTVLFVSCEKVESLNALQLSDYSPAIIGKYITYDLDSTRFINFGTRDTVVHYQVKLVVEEAITDNLNRPAFRVARYIRKTASDAWQSDYHTFMLINTGSSLEFVENNMRFLKLKRPIRNDFSWKGNVYIDTHSAETPVAYLDDWDYTYENVNEPLTLGSINLDSTITVNQRNEILNNPADLEHYSEINISVEKYAKGIGMVYRNFLHKEYQPPTDKPGYALGYGITMTMIDHN